MGRLSYGERTILYNGKLLCLLKELHLDQVYSLQTQVFILALSMKQGSKQYQKRKKNSVKRTEKTRKEMIITTTTKHLIFRTKQRL